MELSVVSFIGGLSIIFSILTFIIMIIKRKTKWVIIFLISIVIFLVCMVYTMANYDNLYGGYNTSYTNNTALNYTDIVASTASNFEIIEIGPEHQDGITYVGGKIKNKTNKEFSYVQIEINLYDEKGTQVGSTFDVINNLEPYGIWHFKAMVIDENAKTYKVKRIIGY